ncbi:hypothetical protein D9757_005150 [Collybiopsis confluens]|uniref:Core-binding (CB) domain-containing protein n=1 Tax=Collybiopsis confluens TaxID=2823264 RepID=A0A8H5HT04_9AGAR|nr:hypothetical protein D9757_005150 [Collybiopsis confluens]
MLDAILKYEDDLKAFRLPCLDGSYIPLHVLTLGSPGVSSDDPRSSQTQIPLATLVPPPLNPHSSSPIISLHPLRSLLPVPPPFTPPSDPSHILEPSTQVELASRKPHCDRKIDNNHLRPNVRAIDRLKEWASPYAIQQKAALSEHIPQHILDSAHAIVVEGWAAQTKTSYAAGLLRWHQFCDKENIPEQRRMPASETLLAGFVGMHAGLVSGSTIRSWLSGIRAWHILNQAPWPEKSNFLSVARRAANIRGSHHRRPRRNPITLQHLLALRLALDFSSPFHCAFLRKRPSIQTAMSLAQALSQTIFFDRTDDG